MPKPTNLSGAYLGCDMADYPGDAIMQSWWDNSPYQFVGYYLQSPCHAHFVPFEGHRATLSAMGWTFLIIYLGQQRPGENCDCNNLTEAQGELDALDAAQRTANEGFPAGSYIYLDIEGGDPFGADILDYLNGWVPEILAGGFQVGIYCSHIMATDVQAAVAALGAPTARFWIAGHLAAQPFNRDTSVPTDNPSGIGVAWQSFPSNEAWGGTTLNIDSSVASLADPSSP